MKYFIQLVIIFFITNSFAQFGYTKIGDALSIPSIPSCGLVDSCFTLTPQENSQSGAVWDTKLINLNNSFDASFCLYFGNFNGWGADGIAFVMRGDNLDTMGNLGAGLGAQGISPSVILELDTWENTESGINDLAVDHSSLFFNGDISNPIQGPISLLPSTGNVDNGATHTVRVKWNATTQLLQMYFDGNLRITHTVDLVNSIFLGNHIVKWGFTASTGGLNNLQQICFPKYTIDLQDKFICENETTLISFYDPNISSYRWTYEDGTIIKDWNSLDYTSPFNLNDSSFLASQSGTYYFDLELNNQLVSDSVVITEIPLPSKVFSKEIALFCNENSNYILDAFDLANPFNTFLWSSGETSSQISKSNSGIYSVIISESQNSCKNYDTLKIINFCKDTIICSLGEAEISFYEPNISSYRWSFEDGTIYKNWNNSFAAPFNLLDTVFNPTIAGKYYFDMTIKNDVIKDSFQLDIVANPNTPFLETEITTCLDEESLILDAQNSGNSYLWSTGDTTQSINIKEEGIYFVEIVESQLNCKNSDTISIISFCTTDVIFPNIFSPNGDSINDFYEVIFTNTFKWISDFQFEIYNRWGTLVYSVKNEAVKWNGKENGNEISNGVYFYKYSYNDAFSKENFKGNGNIQLVR